VSRLTLLIMQKHFLKGQPCRCAFWELVPNWYKLLPPDHFGQAVMNDSIMLSNKIMQNLDAPLHSCILYQTMSKHIFRNVSIRKGTEIMDWVGWLCLCVVTLCVSWLCVSDDSVSCLSMFVIPLLVQWLCVSNDSVSCLCVCLYCLCACDDFACLITHNFSHSFQREQ